jgi:hypothetical protein
MDENFVRADPAPIPCKQGIQIPMQGNFEAYQGEDRVGRPASFNVRFAPIAATHINSKSSSTREHDAPIALPHPDHRNRPIWY